MKKLGIWSMILLVLVFGTMPVPVLAAERTEVSIPVRIMAVGTEPDQTAEYTLELVPQTPGCPMPENWEGDAYRMNLRSGRTENLCIPCDTLGVFDYVLRQIPGTDPDCTYDRREYRIRLYATAAEDGSISTAAMLYGQDAGKETTALFRNHWAAPAYVTISARKTLDGATPEDGAFTFRLTSEDGGLQYEEKNLGRRVVFPALRFDTEGTFRFLLEEVEGSEKGILYDTTKYTIVIDVVRDGDYHANVHYACGDKPWSGFLYFRNYTDTGSPKTGDTIGTWLGLLGFSAVALGVLLAAHRKRQ